LRASRPWTSWGLAAGALLLGLSLLGFWGFVEFGDPLPFFNRKYDPEMAYLLNSLAIFKSRPYMYFDHPGTPVEVIGTVILALMRPALQLGSDDFWTYVIGDPESFLRIAHGLLAAGSAASAGLICLKALKVEDRSDVVMALGAGVSFFTFLPAYAFSTLNFWSHNSFNFPAGTLMLLVLLVRLRSGKPIQAWEIALAGIAAGALTAVQLYFATWVLGTALALGVYTMLTGRGALRSGAGGAGVFVAAGMGFLAATGPILHKYREFSWWVRSLITHQGRYGRGPLGAPSAASLLANLGDLWGESSRLLVAVVLLLGLLCLAGYLNRKEMRSQPGWWALAIGLPVQLVAALLLIAKHPASHYMLAPAAVAVMLLILVLEALRRHGQRLRLLCTGIGAVLLVLFLSDLVQAASRHRAEVMNFELRMAEVTQHIDTRAEELGESSDSMLILWGFGVESRCYALRFGDRYTGRAFRQEINQTCANDWAYEASVDLAELPDGSRSLAEAQGWDLLIIRASDVPSDYERYGQLSYSTDGQIAFIQPMAAGE
jgi:hypothetical protein